MTLIDSLLHLKTFRDDQARRALMRRRVALIDAERARDTAHEAWQRHLTDAIDRENALFEDVRGRLVPLARIADMRAQVAALGRETDRLGQSTQQAEHVLRDERTLLEAACRQAQMAEKAKTKFIDLTERFSAAERHEAVRRDDRDMDEVAAVVRERIEWNVDVDGGD